jgi:murein DD-endopeptidase MepM/ murein hydrolase activator NlpD
MKRHNTSLRSIQEKAVRCLIFSLCLIFSWNNLLAGSDGVYVVERGNTLYSISQQTGVSVSNLQKWNNLTDYTIYPGQKLRVKPLHLPAPAKEDELIKPPDHRNDTISLPLVTPPRWLSTEMISYGLKLAALEQLYDRHLLAALSLYLKPGTFMVDVRLELEPRKEDDRETAPDKLPDYQVDLPGMPFVPDHLIRSHLSGLAAFADFSNLVLPLELKRLHIHVQLDTVYDMEKTEFTKKIIIASAKMEKQRNDRLTITHQAFPVIEPITNVITDDAYIKPLFQERSVSLFWFILTISAVVILIALFLLVVIKTN